uniref:RING-type domain-containing protein n=1 Tax=Neobodo designis TaxID=312471 RepID=A0A7S1PZX1_NEODS|mmetsp:Transcript_25837/g.79739  ORF Transcript_25837/g.79739 Transcript_25837/m.79739 type:complete len:208 (+) Transcript_25837:33-656(+)
MPLQLQPDTPALCNDCAKLPSADGIPVVRARSIVFCTHCGVHALNNKDDTCPADKRHETVRCLQCTECDAVSWAKSDGNAKLLSIRDAIPYADNGEAPCERGGPDCSPHRLRAAGCGHVLCSTCLVRAVTRLLGPTSPSSQHDDHLAQSFTTDHDDFIVPPCPLCYAAGETEEPGAFSLQVLRSLSPPAFNRLKTLANIHFKQLQAA